MVANKLFEETFSVDPYIQMLNIALDGRINNHSSRKVNRLDNTSLWRKILPIAMRVNRVLVSVTITMWKLGE